MKKTFYNYLLMLSVFVLALAGCNTADEKSASSKGSDKVVKIGYQKFNSLHLLKGQGTLEKRLQEVGYKVEWVPFQGGTQLLEALITDNIDLGHAGDGAGVFAQASGKPLVYIASEAPNPHSVGYLVHKDSPIQSVKDLKGKKVAVFKGGAGHYLLAKALKKEGMTFDDIQPVYLKDSSEGKAAFESGDVEAIGLWEPHYAILQTTSNARLLVDGEGYTDYRNFYFSSESFAKEKPELIKIILEELEKVDKWANEHPADVVTRMAPELNIDEAALKLATERRKYGVQKIDDQVIKVQQEMADTFYEIGLIPNKINVEDVIVKNPAWLPDFLK